MSKHQSESGGTNMSLNKKESASKAPALIAMGAISALLGFVLVGFALGWFVAGRDGSPANATQNPVAAAALPTAPAAPQAILPATPENTARTGQEVQPVAPTAALFEAAAAPGAPPSIPNPLFGPNFKADDGLPTYICGIEAAPSYMNLLLIQMSGKDIANGFHLGIVPIELEQAPYELDEDGMRGYMQRGDWDCIIEEIDEVVIGDYGIVTALVDESLGENGIWGRDIPTYYDLAGKRIAFEEKSSAHFFLLHVLSILPPDLRATVTLLPFRTDDAALAAFAEGRADAVSGVGESLFSTSAHGGKHIISSDQLRVIANALITSRKATREKPELVRAFHAAWFDALNLQIKDYTSAAKLISAWGHNEWSQVPVENSASVFANRFVNLAQADLRDNLNIMRNTAPIIDRLELSRQLWSDAGRQVVPDSAVDLINPSFVLALTDRADLMPDINPINNGFTLATAPRPQTAAPAVAAQPSLSVTEALTVVVVTPSLPQIGAATIVTLPCRRFEFAPERAQLTATSRDTLDRCVLPALQQRAGLNLRLAGSAAWPGPAGKYGEGQIRAFGRLRAQAIAEYLASKGIDPARLTVEEVVPPIERRESVDGSVLALDRFVEMTLIASP
jgi:outer membrane protein OmpA-like peptidoglycan-associated protein